MSITLARMIKNKDAVIAFARKSQNPLYQKSLLDYEAALSEYSRSLERLFMAVKLADSEDLEKNMLDSDNWDKMSPSEKQRHRIKKGLWSIGTPRLDGFEY